MTGTDQPVAGHPPPWREVYHGGSPHAEQEHVCQLGSAIVGVTDRSRPPRSARQ